MGQNTDESSVRDCMTKLCLYFYGVPEVRPGDSNRIGVLIDSEPQDTAGVNFTQEKE